MKAQTWLLKCLEALTPHLKSPEVAQNSSSCSHTGTKEYGYCCKDYADEVSTIFSDCGTVNHLHVSERTCIPQNGSFSCADSNKTELFQFLTSVIEHLRPRYSSLQRKKVQY